MDRNSHSNGRPFPAHRDDEISRLLLDPQDVEEQPSFSLTFSTIRLLRIPIIPIAIADSILMSNAHDHIVLGVLFEALPVGLCLWTAFSVFGTPATRRNSFELTVGDYVLFWGRKGQDLDTVSERKTRPYQIILGDFFVSLLLILLTVLSLTTHIWQYDVRLRVFSLSLTLSILQLALTVLNFFTLFRKAKLTLHMAENDQNFKYVIPEAYSDEESHSASVSSGARGDENTKTLPGIRH
ncbi:hypothetical protein BGZ61DRAFT_461945 [Ilyonectria robusta]|uniref:uncharacterized protein n=1 Tax=Ilyonectria robusta TaxID=1079257 RepID=UPI001E8D609F|nr:uncharacterized protein BGZ61DRAFT_461945 [Ilyonectria robusta]KAH8665614.1 hypothetical protein BGZ61DRAFT_461945 [Ilyonectria robusta]